MIMQLLLSCLLVLLIAWVVIYPVTDYYTRLVDPGVLKRGSFKDPKLYLSFDDGPDCNYTPALLRILQEHKVRATFFVIAAKAERHPELVNAILAAGHEIGLHTYDHRHAYWLGRQASKTTIRKGVQVLQSLTGTPVEWLRFPWGAANFFGRMEARRNNLKVVLWTANAQDWLLKTRADGITARLVRRVKSGAIIVLHDSGGEPGAPLQMLQALPAVLAALKAAGYQFETLREVAGGKC
jgi:peptidoglycan/xylan/chitin deacetylase (PgdA/CDA1 family)